MLSLYFNSDSPIHSLPAGLKLSFLVVLGTTLFLISNIPPIVAALVGIFFLYIVAKIPFRLLIAQIKPALFLLAVIFLAQGLINSWELGLLVVVRFAVLILAASLVTLTTLTSDLVMAIERALSPFSRWVPVEKVSLAISLAIRFIPVIATLTKEVREAQRVRGLEKNIFAVAMPVVIRTLKMGDQVAEALDARSFDTDNTADVRKH